MKPIIYVQRKKCGICGCESLQQESKIYDFDSHLGTFDLVKCPRCGMYYTSPYPNAQTLANLYLNRNTRNFDTQNSNLFFKIKCFLAKRLIKQIIKDCPSKQISVADFGCGNGMFARCFEQLMPQACITAVDFSPNPPALFTSKQVNETNLAYLQVDDFYNDSKKYDIIFLRHVLEHVENPENLLKALLRKLTENGFIYLEVPNIKNGLRRFWDKYLPSYYPPYHLVHFTPENLKFLCSKLGVKCQLSQAEMPLMSNIVANRLGQKLNNFHRLLGVFLHPLQLVLCRRNHTVLVAQIYRAPMDSHSCVNAVIISTSNVVNSIKHS